MRTRFDYTIDDSTHHNPIRDMSIQANIDNSINVGMVREEKTDVNGQTRYIVEVYKAGKQIPLSCTSLTRFGGVHNFEEFRMRPWAKDQLAGPVSPASASTFDLRSGDMVVVAQLGGSGREGVILGGLNHPARTPSTSPGEIAYRSCFQGLDTTIEDSGAYRVTFNGKPANTALLDIPPSGVQPPPPVPNAGVAGSYFEFDALGTYRVSDGSQTIAIKKQTGVISITSGDTILQVGGPDPFGIIQVGLTAKSPTVALEGLDFVGISSDSAIFIQSGGTAIMTATNIGIGNAGVELLDTIVKIIDGLGDVTVTSPVGLCQPIKASPQWAKVEALKILIDQLKAPVGPKFPIAGS